MGAESLVTQAVGLAVIGFVALVGLFTLGYLRKKYPKLFDKISKRFAAH